MLYKRTNVLWILILIIVSHAPFFNFTTTVAEGSELTGIYDCNSGEKIADPPGPYYQVAIIDGLISVTSGNYCSGEVNIPSGIEAIADGAFTNSGIEKITFPTTLTLIGSFAFNSNPYLHSINFSNGDVEIGKGAFSQCSVLNNVDLKNGKKNIGEWSFGSTPNLTNFDFGSGIEVIGTTAFTGSALTNLKFPNSLKEIGARAFEYLETLTKVDFGGNEETIGEAAFRGTRLTEIEIPQKIFEIKANTFKDIPTLIGVKIPDSVNLIGEYSFANNSNLTNVHFGNNVTKVSGSAFLGANIETLILPNSLKEIGNNAFNYISNLKHLYLGNGIETITTGAFANNFSLKKLHIPGSIRLIENDAFINSDFEQVSFSDQASGISATAFTNYDFGTRRFYNAKVYFCKYQDVETISQLQSLDYDLWATIIWLSEEFHWISDSEKRLFYCEPPTAPEIISTKSVGPSSAVISLISPLISGGSDITELRIESSDGSISQTFSDNANSSYTVNGLKSSTTYSFKAYSINSKGVSLPSNISASITTSTVISEEESLARQREAERLRQIEITKARDTLLRNVQDGVTFTLLDLQKSDFNGATKDNFTKIQKEIDKRIADVTPSIELIQAAIKYVVVIEEVSRIDQSGRKMYSNSLVEIGLISSASKNKTQIFYLVKQAPADFRKDEESLVNLITRIEAEIKARNDRLAALRARTEARIKAA